MLPPHLAQPRHALTFVCSCPGRHFAEAELSLLLALLVLLYDWQLLPGEHDSSGSGNGSHGSGVGSSSRGSGAHCRAAAAPGDPGGLLAPPDLRKLVGIKVPAGPCWAQATRRSVLC